MENPIQQLCQAIDYPEKIPEDRTSCTLLVDGCEIHVVLRDPYLRFIKVLEKSDSHIVRFAEMAAGRILKDDLVVAWDEKMASCVLWQELPSDSEERDMRRAFESFLNACDWWGARMSEIDVPQASFPDILIRP